MWSTLVFDISSQTKHETKTKEKTEKQRNKIYANLDQISKHRHGYNILCLDWSW